MATKTKSASRGRVESKDGPISANVDRLTETLKAKLSNPAVSPEFDLHAGVADVLRDVGMTAADGGGRLSFYGQDPILPSPHRFGTMAAIGSAAKSIAAAAVGARPGRAGHPR